MVFCNVYSLYSSGNMLPILARWKDWNSWLQTCQDQLHGHHSHEELWQNSAASLQQCKGLANYYIYICYMLYTYRTNAGLIPKESSLDSRGTGVRGCVCASNCLNSALQSPNGGSPVPLERLGHCQTTSCCLPAEGDGRSGRHPERNRQTSSGHVRVSAALMLPLSLITNTSTPCMWPKLLYHVSWSDWDFWQ